jgi:hypothetical protein
MGNTMGTIKEYVLENFNENEIKGICTNGMVSGFRNLIYYKDTCAFHDLYEEEIWQMLWDDKEEQGLDSIPDLIASFRGKEVGGMDQFKNLLCWYAVEKVCFDLSNEEVII